MSNPVQQKSGLINTGGITTQTLSITLTNPVTVGNSIIVLFAYTNNTGTISITSVGDDKGNTYTQQINQTRAGITSPIAVYTALAITNGPKTITIITGNSVSATMATAANVYEDTGTVLDTAIHGTTTNSTVFVANFATGFVNDSAYAVSASNNGNETYTQNNGFTQDFFDSSDTESFYFHNSPLSIGANSLNMTASVAVYTLWGIVALAPSAAPGPPVTPARGPMPKCIYILP